jgi:hypothetical protein
MDEADVPDKIQKRLVGHAAKDQHGKYGGKLQELNRWMQKVKPLQDH